MTDSEPVLSADRSPKRIGEILDKGFGVTLYITRLSAPAMLVFGIVNGAAEATTGSTQLLLRACATLTNLFGIVALYMAVDAWKGNTTSFQAGAGRLRWRLLLRSFSAGIRIGFFGLIRLPLLLFPAFNYWLNQVLTPYLVLVEELSIEAAMARSKFLMSREPWYSMTGAKMRYSGIIIVSTVFSLSLAILGGVGVALGEEIDNHILRMACIVSVGALSSFLVWMGTIFTQVLMVGFYNDLQARYEGVDLLGSDGWK